MEIRLRLRLNPLLVTEHVAFLLALVSGSLLAWSAGLLPSHAAWLGLKLGLVLFLVVPLEAMHAYMAHVWIARGLGRTAGDSYDKDLSRGLGVEEMLRALALPLLGVALPLIAWLSFSKPF